MRRSPLRRFATPLALLVGLVLFTSSAWAAGGAPATPAPKSAANQARSDAMKAKWQDPAYRANVAKARFGGNSVQAKKARAEGQWADPVKAAEMVIARHGAAAPSLNKYYEAVKAKYGGNSPEARKLRAQMQWAKPGGRDAIMAGRASARAGRVAASEAAAAEAPGESPFEFGSGTGASPSAVAAAVTPAAPPSFVAPGSPSRTTSPSLTASPSLGAPASGLSPSRGRGARILSGIGLGRFVVSRDVRGLLSRAEARANNGDVAGAIEMLPTEGTQNLTRGEIRAMDNLRGKLYDRQAVAGQRQPGE